MNTKLISVNSKDFAAVAERFPSLWLSVVDAEIFHADHGKGEITHIPSSHSVRIYFDSWPRFKEYSVSQFINGEFVFSIYISEQIAADLSRKEKLFLEIKEEEKEEKIRKEISIELGKELRKLANKYHVLLSKVNQDIIAPLLLKLEKREGLNKNETDYLKANSLDHLLATYHYREFKSGGDVWDLVKTSSSLRKAGMSKRAIEITGKYLQLLNSGDVAYAALLTSRGGAFRDIRDTNSARNCATNAMNKSAQSPHPHNLMGAIHYQEGHPSQGDKQFEKAITLGGSRKNQEFQIRSAFKHASQDARRAIAKHLLDKDPVVYKWANRYVDLT